MNSQPNDVNQSNPTVPIYDSVKFKAPRTQNKKPGRRGGSTAMLTIVNTPNYGKRIAISPNVIEQLGSPEFVQVGIGEDGIAIAGQLPGNDSTFKLRESANKSVIYSVSLVENVTESYNLDFSGRSSISFLNYSFMKTEDGETVAFFPLKEHPSAPPTLVPHSPEGEPSDDELFE